MKFTVQLVVLLGVFVHAAMSQSKLVRRRMNGRAKYRARAMKCDGDVEFELITGFVYSNADDIIESNIGALRMQECIEECKKNPLCLALNFETGLCVQFRTAAGERSGL